MKLTESVYLLSDLMAMGVADLEGIAAAGDKEQYPVRIGRCSTFSSLCCLVVILVVMFVCLLHFVEWSKALAAGRVVRSSLLFSLPLNS